MIRTYLLALVGLMLTTTPMTQLCWAHEDARVGIEKDEEVDVKAGQITFTFQLLDLEKKVVLTEADLSVVNEKKLHMFIFDPALKELRHEHPEYVGSGWRLTTNLPVTGNYWVWAQGTIAADKAEFSAEARLNVIDGTPANALPPQLGNVRVGTDGASKVTLSNEKIKAKKMTMLTVTFSRTDGKKPVLTPYMGELAHVIGASEDGETFIHSHAMDHGKPNELMLHATFPRAGKYRLWVQFVDGGILRTVALSVPVFER